jgi:hypothetical protein
VFGGVEANFQYGLPEGKTSKKTTSKHKHELMADKDCPSAGALKLLIGNIPVTIDICYKIGLSLEQSKDVTGKVGGAVFLSKDVEVG